MWEDDHPLNISKFSWVFNPSAGQLQQEVANHIISSQQYFKLPASLSV
jgi:hypothetical protein